MITAAVVVAVFGFALGGGYIWGAQKATNDIADYLSEQPGFEYEEIV